MSANNPTSELLEQETHVASDRPGDTLRGFAAVLLFLSLSCLPISAHERIVAITGAGVIEVLPDIINIEVTVYKHDENSLASAKNHVDMVSSNAVAALIANGVSEQEIYSSSITFEKVFRYDDNDNRIPAGYAASRDIEFMVRKVDSYDGVIQALVDVGIVDLNSVSPNVSNRDALSRQALEMALTDARETAELLAHKLGASLKRVHQIGNRSTYFRSDYEVVEEEIVVTASYDASGEHRRYMFHPGPITVESDIYVEFIIE